MCSAVKHDVVFELLSVFDGVLLSERVLVILSKENYMKVHIF